MVTVKVLMYAAGCDAAGYGEGYGYDAPGYGEGTTCHWPFRRTFTIELLKHFDGSHYSCMV